MDLEFRLIDKPDVFDGAIASWSRQPRLWIDIEVADYYRPDAHVATLQVRDSEGAVTVVDCLRDGMPARLKGNFVPKIMQSSAVEKWAHCARYEQRFLGREAVQNLRCTLALSKELPYYHLPTRSWSLASLVRHFWGEDLDKSFQRIDWGKRPLNPEAWSYAAWDAEWCHRLWERLSAEIEEHSVPSTPAGIAARFAEMSPGYKRAKKQKEAVWTTLREFMLAEERAEFGPFHLSDRDYTKIELGAFVDSLGRADPHALVTCPLSLTKRDQEALGEAAEAVREASEVTGGESFRVPSDPRSRPAPVTYELDPNDPERVARDHLEADHEFRLVDSERTELKKAIKGIMREEGVDELLGFRFTSGASRWRIDPRELHRLASGLPLERFRLTAKVSALFENGGFTLPEEGVEIRSGKILRRRQPKSVLAHEIEMERLE